VRIHWFFSWMLLASLAGCAGPGSFGTARTAEQPQQTQFASQPTPGFTQRMIDAIVPGPPKTTPQLHSGILQPDQQKLDPISLGYKSGPPNAKLYLSMAQLSDRSGKADEARDMYQKTLSLEPTNLKALLGLARLEDREGRMDEALRNYQLAAGAYPQNAQVLNDLALCHARIGQLPVALHLLKQAAQYQPQKPLYRNNIAKVLIEMNRIDEALSHQSTVHPPAVAQYNVGLLLYQRGRTAEAVHFLTAATHIDPQLQAPYTLLSQINNHTTRVVDSSVSAPNDSILPTPMTPPVTASGQSYPTTGAMAEGPVMRTMPAETAQVPVGHAPTLLPPVR